VASPVFLTEDPPPYGTPTEVAPLVRRVVAENPSKFTYHGTGTYLVGRGRVAIVDAGPALDAHVDALLDALAGEQVTHVLATHTHRDHSPASRAIAAATGAPLLGYGPHPPEALAAERAAIAARAEARARAAAEREAEPEGATPPDGETEADGGAPPEGEEEPGDADFVPDVVLRHGDVVAGEGWTLQALHTPGHISNHLCYRLLETRTLFSGDHVMGWSTSVVPPPDGRIGDYLASLRLLLDADDVAYLPTHGPAITDPQGYVAALLDHRLERERQIVAVLREGPLTIPAIVAVLYADVREELHPVAARSVAAHLVHLAERGAAAEGEPVRDDTGEHATWHLLG
jgi:glyoxylase-like metal-dependent hydrolase (beta-lactamase superfamily II)